MVDVKSSDDTQIHVHHVAPEVASANANSEVNATTEGDVRRRLPRVSAATIQTAFVGVIALGLGVVLWHLATLYNVSYFINFENVPSPGQVGNALITHVQDQEFYIHIVVSIQRILIAYCLAGLLGIPTGLLTGRSRLVRAAVLPYIEIVRPIPAVAWIPLAILMWPTEESSIVYITFLGALFPIILQYRTRG